VSFSKPGLKHVFLRIRLWIHT